MAAYTGGQDGRLHRGTRWLPTGDKMAAYTRDKMAAYTGGKDGCIHRGTRWPPTWGDQSSHYMLHPADMALLCVSWEKVTIIKHSLPHLAPFRHHLYCCCCFSCCCCCCCLPHPVSSLPGETPISWTEMSAVPLSRLPPSAVGARDQSPGLFRLPPPQPAPRRRP